MTKHVVYDIETYPNLFTVAFKDLNRSVFESFEISERRDQRQEIIDYVKHCDRMIGFNNMGFDWPVLKALLEAPRIGVGTLYELADNIIKTDSRFGAIDWRPSVEQLDLYRIHHYDNRAKSTSLKALEFNMRMTSIKDLPIEPGTEVPVDRIDEVLAYNCHDVRATELFYYKSLDKIQYRERLGPKFLNFSDTKIGTQFFIDRLEWAGVECFWFDRDNKRRPRQTLRPDGVRLNDIVFDWIEFDDLELELLLADVKEQVITDTRGAYERKVSIGNIEATFGLGGLHGSVKRRKYTDGVILDLDVKGYYPSLIAVQRLYPEHLGEKFCDVCAEIVAERDETEKGTDLNKTLKLGGNSVFGMTNSEFGPFFDPACMLGITINGQLLALLLAEQLLTIDGLELIQANTDGVTIYLPPGYEDRLTQVRAVAEWWQNKTGMTLEEAQYKRLFIRDVNNYIGEFIDGKRKRKGAYEYEREWHQNHSGLVVPKGAEAVLLEDADPEAFVMLHPDPWDFMYRIKATKKNPLIFNKWKPDEYDYIGVLRYYLSKDHPDAIIFKKRLKRGVGNLHLLDIKGLKGSRGKWTCPDCGEVHRLKSDLQAHIQTVHAPKFVIKNEYEGEPIDIDVRSYISAINELTRDFV